MKKILILAALATTTTFGAATQLAKNILHVNANAKAIREASGSANITLKRLDGEDHIITVEKQGHKKGEKTLLQALQDAKGDNWEKSRQWQEIINDNNYKAEQQKIYYTIAPEERHALEGFMNENRMQLEITKPADKESVANTLKDYLSDKYNNAYTFSLKNFDLISLALEILAKLEEEPNTVFENLSPDLITLLDEAGLTINGQNHIVKKEA